MSKTTQNLEIVVSDVPATRSWRTCRFTKIATLYLTMVLVSTSAIFLLEHVTLINAFRTALVAAIGKTVAANWVAGLFS